MSTHVAAERTTPRHDAAGIRLVQAVARAMARLATWPLLLSSTAVFVGFAGVFFRSGAPFAIPRVEAVCRQAPPDMRFTSSAAEVLGFLDACGATGREAYRHLQVADLLYPAVFGLFMATATAFAVSRLAPARPSVLALAAVPLIGSAFDYVENLCAWLALTAYPLPAPTSSVLGLASAAKNVASWAAGVVLLVALGLLLARGLRRSPRLAGTRRARASIGAGR